MVEKTLFKMHQGGFYDHIGDGFHRYSTDEKWILPHFEKMLYDQAWLSYAYTFCYELTGKPFYKKIAESIYDFVVRDMTNIKGGFYSAFDADTEGEEGKFYIWSIEELKKNLSNDEYKFLNENFELSEEGNYLDEATHEKTKHNVFFLKESLENKSDSEIENYFNKFQPIKGKLLKLRAQRPKRKSSHGLEFDYGSIVFKSSEGF